MKNSLVLKKLFNVLIFTFLAINLAMAQAGSEDFFRNIGKIYVVVAVVLATFLGIIFFLVYLSRKIRKLEEKFDN